MLVDIQIFILILTIMGLLLSIPFFLVYMTNREHKENINWNKASEYYQTERGIRTYYDTFNIPIATILLSMGVIQKEWVLCAVGLGFLIFIVFILTEIEVIISQRSRLNLLYKTTFIWAALLALGIFTNEFKILTYLWGALLGFYAGFKLHEAKVLDYYQKSILKNNSKPAQT